MSANNGKKKSRGSGVGALIFAIIMVVSAVSRNDEIKFNIRVFFHRLGQNLSLSQDGKKIFAAAAALIVGLIALAIVLRAASRKKERFEFRSARHSHDRLQGYADGSCPPEEHWRRQLDGFLAAGIIDRSEYRVLMERRRR